MLSNSGPVPLIRYSYEVALIHLLGGNEACKERLASFKQLLSVFRRGVDIFYAHMRDLPSRCSSFHTIAGTLVREFQQQFVGGTLRALTLTQRSNGRTEALTDNYQKLWLKGELASNRMLTARIHSIEGEALVGEVHD